MPGFSVSPKCAIACDGAFDFGKVVILGHQPQRYEALFDKNDSDLLGWLNLLSGFCITHNTSKVGDISAALFRHL